MAAVPQEAPVVLSRSNRWARSVNTEEQDRQKRLEGSVLAIQVLLPDLPEDDIRHALERHNGDPDAALQELLGGDADDAPQKKEAKCDEDDEDARAMAEALAVAAAAEEEEAAQEKAIEELKAASQKAVPAPPAKAPEPEVAPPTPVEPEKPAVPAWLPVLQQEELKGSGTTSNSRQKGYYDKQTDRLKAALGPSPASKVGIIPSAHDLDVRGKGPGGKGKQGGG
eukprot:gb/GFBE01016551.1/.p1 GENE.gb/GFBE01016551.1/~~gb/GFBE01016551.1/.p1  ORF type:complete len:225 (+),score=67.80 gb/GFBE01016551.1/:1-675(+)